MGETTRSAAAVAITSREDGRCTVEAPAPAAEGSTP